MLVTSSCPNFSDSFYYCEKTLKVFQSDIGGNRFLFLNEDKEYLNGLFETFFCDIYRFLNNSGKIFGSVIFRETRGKKKQIS